MTDMITSWILAPSFEILSLKNAAKPSQIDVLISSASLLEGLRQFFDNLPPTSGIAFRFYTLLDEVLPTRVLDEAVSITTCWSAREAIGLRPAAAEPALDRSPVASELYWRS